MCTTLRRGGFRLRLPLADRAELDKTSCYRQGCFSRMGRATAASGERGFYSRFRELLEKNTDKIAEAITSEHGKVFSDAKGEVTRGLEVVEFAHWDSSASEGRILRAGGDRHR